MNALKKHFFSGLIFIVPVSLSIWILFKIISFFDNIIGGFLKKYLPSFYTPGIGFLSLLLIILLLGFLADNFLGKKLLNLFENLFEKVPIINRIYIFIKGISQNLLHGKATAFRESVKIEFFSGTYTIGFITGESRLNNKEGFVSVFVPTVPNISTGFYLLVPENKIEKLNLSVEETLKMVISMGIFEPKNGSSENRSDSTEKK
jgi:uncharacterized membrane protein